MEEQRIYGETYQSPIGALTILSGDKGIKAIKFYEDEKVKAQGRTNEMTRWAVKELEEYFQGKRKAFTVPCVPKGTDFQKRVWEALIQIPYGETRTYKEIAAAAGNPKASRAVGMANNRNPIPIIIPCHRVIGTNGSLTGYAGGLKVKEYLLKLESNLVICQEVIKKRFQ